MFLQPSVHRSIASPSIGCFCRSFSTDNRCSVRSTHLLKEGPFFDFFPSLLKSCREQIASTIKTYLHWIIFVRIIFSLRTDLFSSMEIQTKPIDCQGWMDPWNFEYCKSGVFHRDSWTLLSLFSLSTHVIKGVSSTSKRCSLSNGFCENVTKENLCWLTFLSKKKVQVMFYYPLQTQGSHKNLLSKSRSVMNRSQAHDIWT